MRGCIFGVDTSGVEEDDETKRGVEDDEEEEGEVMLRPASEMWEEEAEDAKELLQTTSLRGLRLVGVCGGPAASFV